MQRKIRAIKIYGVQIKVRVVVSKMEHRKRIAGISDWKFFFFSINKLNNVTDL